MAAASMRDDTFPKLLARNAQTRGARPAVRHKDLGIWQSWTWAEVNDICRAYAVALKGPGAGEGRHHRHRGLNRPRLYWSMMAAQMLGAVPVPVYADSVADEMAYVLAHADVKLAAVEDQEQVDKLLSISDRLPRLQRIVYDEDRGLRILNGESGEVIRQIPAQEFVDLAKHLDDSKGLLVREHA